MRKLKQIEHNIPCARAVNIVSCDPNYIFSSVNVRANIILYTILNLYLLFVRA